MLLQTDGVKKQKKDRDGVPDPKKFVRTGERSFVVEAEGGNRFEGEIKNPNAVQFKGSGRIILTNVGICLKHCSNRDKKCNSCFRFSELKELADACA
jgi:hypothetical protein